LTRSKKARKKARKAPKAKAPKRAEKAVLVTPAVMEELNLQQKDFVRLYDKYLGNGARAYAEAYPGCESYGAACAAASRLLRSVNVRSAVDALRAKRWERMQMSGDEALALMGNNARADVRQLFDDNGELLKPQDWPDDVAAAVESVDLVNGKVKLASKAQAQRVILEQTGKLKNPLEGGFDRLAMLLGDKFEEAKP
jgi:hypothetical protein